MAGGGATRSPCGSVSPSRVMGACMGAMVGLRSSSRGSQASSAPSSACSLPGGRVRIRDRLGVRNSIGYGIVTLARLFTLTLTLGVSVQVSVGIVDRVRGRTIS